MSVLAASLDETYMLSQSLHHADVEWRDFVKNITLHALKMIYDSTQN